MKERLKRLVIGVATMAGDNFRKRGSRLFSPADLYRSRFCSSFRTSAIWIWVKGEMVGALAGCCGGCRAVDRGRGSHVESMASRREMLIEILNYSGIIVIYTFLL